MQERTFNIRASVTLRKQIVKLINDNNLSIAMVCDAINFKYPEFVMWLNAKDGGRPVDNMSEFKIMRLCELLGIEIQVRFIQHPLPAEALINFKNSKITEAVERKKQKRKDKITEFFKDED